MRLPEFIAWANTNGWLNIVHQQDSTRFGNAGNMGAVTYLTPAGNLVRVDFNKSENRVISVDTLTPILLIL